MIFVAKQNEKKISSTKERIEKMTIRERYRSWNWFCADREVEIP